MKCVRLTLLQPERLAMTENELYELIKHRCNDCDFAYGEGEDYCRLLHSRYDNCRCAQQAGDIFNALEQEDTANR